MPRPEEIEAMTPEEKRRSLAEFVEYLREQAGPPVEVFVPRPFALAIDFEDVEMNDQLRAADIVAVGIECDTDAVVRVRNPYTRHVDNLLFASAEQARAELGRRGGGPVRLIWGKELVPIQ